MSSNSEENHPLRRARTAETTSLGTFIMATGRLADIGLQYLLLRNGGEIPANLLGVSANLSPEFSSVLLGLFSITAARHAYWALVMNQNDLAAPMATSVVLFNTAFNTIGTFVATWSASRGDSLGLESPMLWGGAALVLAGVAIEMISEEQRKAFKQDPKNKGRAFTKGLNGVVQHPNYLGYTLWRTGLMLATGSHVAAGVACLFNLGTFLGSSIPELQAHNLRKYGDEYRQYTLRVPKLIPFVL